MDKTYFRPVTATEANNGNRSALSNKSLLKRPGTALGVSTDHEIRKSHSLKVSVSFFISSGSQVPKREQIRTKGEITLQKGTKELLKPGQMSKQMENEKYLKFIMF